MTTPIAETIFRTDESFARLLDREDHLVACRKAFEIPRRPNGEPCIYLCGNSLGLMPTRARTMVEEELNAWSRLAVGAHFAGDHPWYSYHAQFRETGARLVGAQPGEVVMMNSLTVNLHLMMVSFYRPTETRFRILMETPTFPSDTYAVRSHLRSRGIDPDEAILLVGPRNGEHCVREEDLYAVLNEQGGSIALTLLAGVNFLTGQALDIRGLTAAAREQGCIAGWDLAHAAGNLSLQLHDWDVDFACWCSYKYLNASPGAVAGCFIHERHAARTDLPRYGGWWGNDPDTRFHMHLEPEFRPHGDADGWQLSNPPILSMAPLRASLAIFDEVGMPALRRKTLRLTPYLRFLVEQHESGRFEVITPRDPEAHGCQLSIIVHDDPRSRFRDLEEAGIICDFREPNVIRVAPAPLYNSYHDAWQFAQVLNR